MIVKNDIFIPHSKPTIGQAEINAVTEVLASGQIAQGSVVEKFEHEFADYFGFESAVATSSGTAALHLALLGLDVRQGDEVIIPGYVCTALLNVVNYVGATPVLADVDPETGNISTAGIKGLLTPATRAIIVPHMFGLPVDLEPLADLGIPIIEDCAQAVGATTANGPVGTSTDLSIFSFYATKMLTTGEGGMVVCRTRDMAERIKDLRSYDERVDYKTRYNYKLTDIQAALGRCQLKRLEHMLSQRRSMALYYCRKLRGVGPSLPAADERRIFFRFTISIKSDLEEWIRRMKKYQIGCARPVYSPLTSYLDRDISKYPGTRHAFRSLLSLPIYPSLEKIDLDRVVSAVKEIQSAIG